MRATRFSVSNLLPYLILACVAVFAIASWLATGHVDPHHLVLFGAVVVPQIGAGDVSSLNTVAADFIEYMDPGKVFDLIWDNNPELTLIGKNTEVQGLYLDHAVKYGGTQGIALGGYGNALANQTPEKYATFHVPMANLFGIGTLNNLAMKASKSRKGAFEDLVQGALRSSIKDCANELTRAIMSDGTATIGQIAAITVSPAGYPSGSAQIELGSDLSYQFFENGMTVDFTLSDGSAPLGAPDTCTVLAVDAAAAYLVLSPPTAGSWGSGYFVIGNYIIRDGNYSASNFGQAISTQSGVNGFSPMQFASMGAWNPSSEFRQNPGLAAAQFLNVSRQLDGTRLAGMSYPGGNMQIDKALVAAAVRAGIYSEGPEYCSINPDSYNALLQILQGQKLYGDPAGHVDVTANIAYDFVVLHGGPKPMKVISSRNVPPKRARLWSPDDWELASVGECPVPMEYTPGQMFLGLPDQDAIQFKSGGYMNLVCKKPVNVVNVTLQQ